VLLRMSLVTPLLVCVCVCVSRIQRRQSGLKSGGSWIQVNKIDFQGKFLKNFDFFHEILHTNFEFSRQISEIFLAISQKNSIF